MILNWIDILARYQQQNEPVALVTVTKCLGSAPCVLGSRMVITTDKKIHGTVGGGKLEFEVIDAAVAVIKSNKKRELTFTLGPKYEQCCGGKVDLLIEPMNQSPELFLFGAGHIGVEVCNLLKGTPFQVHLIDSRENWFTNITVDAEVTTIAVDTKDFTTFRNAVRWGSRCYVLVMTHDHGIDLDIIAMAIPQETKYLGLIGSKTKYHRFHSMLTKELQIPEGMDAVICPVGLPTGGDTPKEIAIGIAAQLLKVHYEV